MSVTVRIGDRVHQNDAMCALVEGLCDVPETLLPRGVPDIERDGLVIVVDSLYLEVYSDRAQVVCLKTVLAVSHQ